MKQKTQKKWNGFKVGGGIFAAACIIAGLTFGWQATHSTPATLFAAAFAVVGVGAAVATQYGMGHRLRCAKIVRRSK